MFICDECLKENFTNSPSLAKSNGICEWCDTTQNCSEIPSGKLHTKNKPDWIELTDEDKIKLFNILVDKTIHTANDYYLLQVRLPKSLYKLEDHKLYKKE